MKRNRKKKIGLIFTFLIGVLCITASANDGLTQDRISLTESRSGLHLQQADNYLTKIIELDISDQTRLEALKTIADKAGMRISYDTQLTGLDDFVTLNHNAITVEDALWKVLEEASIRFAVSANGQLALFPFEKTLEERRIVQTGTIAGKVIDAESGESLPGANVFIQGTTTGASTDENGQFTLEDVEVGTHTLVATFVGYGRNEQQVTVTENEITTVNFEMAVSSTEFDEVVVVGYGTVNQRDLTGSVSTISSDDLENLSPAVNIDQALQGKAAGVHVMQSTGQPGSAARVRIRGSSSLLGSNQPLYVIDGIPITSGSIIPDDGSSLNTELLQQGLNSPLGNINPNDIKSISILKDASAAAIYGSRAANGVIIITTKRGSDQGRALFNASYSVSTQEARTSEVLNAEQFRTIYTEAVKNSEVSNSFTQSVLDGSYFGNANTNWEEEVSRSTPITSNFDFSARGGNEQIQYSTTVGVKNENGVFENASFERYTGSLNLDAQLADRLDLGTRLHLSSSTQLAPDELLLERIYDFRPDIPVYDEDGSYSASGSYGFENPVALSQARTENKTTQFLGSLFGEFEISDELLFKSSLKLEHNRGNFSSIYPSFTYRGGWRNDNPGDGFAKEGSSTFTSHIWENKLTYQQLIGNAHSIKAILGASWQGDRNEYLQASGRGFPKDEILTNLSSATGDFTISSNETLSGLASYFSRVNYDYDNRYLLTLSARADRSSKFAEDNQWGFFPAVAGAWRISNESFFSGIDFVDDLKLRASVGITGSTDFGPYQWRTLFTAGQYAGDAAIYKSQLGNSKLQWETTRQLDVGLDFILFDNRLSGSIAYYEKHTEDLLYFFKTPGNTGFDTAISNLGNTQNRGIEFSLEGDIIRRSDFVWNLSANISHNRNKLVKLNDDFLNVNEGVINPPNTGSVLKVGEPLGLIYGYVSEGVFQTQKAIDELNSNAPDGAYQDPATSPGDLKFKDLNGDGEITDADETIIGNAQPDFTGGFTNTFGYKGFSLSALFTYSVGNDLRWLYGAYGTNFGSTFRAENKSVKVLNRWTPENPTNQPRAVYLDPNDNDRTSSYYVHDASYLRLKNLNLTYNLPSSIRPGFLRRASIYVTAMNLLTFTKYPGADPETSNIYDDDVSSGLDLSRYPRPKVYTIGVNIGF